MDLGLKPSETFLNINLGEKINRDLTQALTESTGRSAQETKQSLGSFNILVEDILKYMRENHGKGGPLTSHYPSISLDNFTHLTGEEKALASEYAVALAILPDANSRLLWGSDLPPVLQVYRANRDKAQEKAGYAQVTNYDTKNTMTGEMSQPQVGTTEQRMRNIEWLVNGLVKGPTDKDPFWTRTVNDYVTTDLGYKVPAGIHNYAETNPDLWLRNDLKKSDQFRDRVIGTIEGLMKVVPNPQKV